MNVVIMRGIPGSGKSRYAQGLLSSALVGVQRTAIYSADDYHIREGGLYQFRIEDSTDSHIWCYRNCLAALGFNRHQPHGQESTGHQATETLVVDNTNCAAWEIAPYWQAALVAGASVKIVRIHCSFEVACQRNVHDVPPSTIWRMWQTLQAERLPAHWREDVVLG